MGVDRQDVDDGAALAAHDHVGDRCLHQEEGCAGVDGEQRFPVVEASVEERGAIGEAGGVDQSVDALEAGEAGCDQSGRRLGVREIGGDELGWRAHFAERRRRGLAARRLTAGDQQAGGAGARKRLGDRQADALRRACDQRHLAVEPNLHPSSMEQSFYFFKYGTTIPFSQSFRSFCPA